MKKLFSLIFINLSVFCTLIVVLEMSGQILYYVTHDRFIFEDSPGIHHTQLFELHPYLAGRLRKSVIVEEEGKQITTTHFNTRWTGAPQDDSTRIRIAVLGGSTTFGSGVDDRDSWPALLQEKLGDRFSVTNYGVPGYSTAEAIIQMALIVTESHPHFVIHYHGWNDIRNYHKTDLGSDYYGHGITQYQNLFIPTFKEKTVLEKFNDLSATVRLAHSIGSKLSGPTATKSFPSFNVPDPLVDSLYVRNLRTLKLLSSEIPSYSLFIPQVLNFEMFESKKEPYWWSVHIENDAMRGLMGEFNALMKSVCSMNDPDCLFVKSVLMEEWTQEDFVDNGHFSRDGGENFIEIISPIILREANDRFSH